ncbi:MAG: hypothetical protein JRF63_13890 [Deltaproteobacteria bacterium]|nr:hypothetical protein [Deltaproteobacteria bacterium]
MKVIITATVLAVSLAFAVNASADDGQSTDRSADTFNHETPPPQAPRAPDERAPSECPPGRCPLPEQNS